MMHAEFPSSVPRMNATRELTNAYEGRVKWAPRKSLWISGMFATAIVGGALTISFETLALFIVTTAITVLDGHSLGMHRRLIHESNQCSL